MRPLFFLLFALIAFVPGASAAKDAATVDAKTPEWALNATIIEACSCPMFCQCYFNKAPADHTGHSEGAKAEHFCRFNNAFRVNKGNLGATKLDGMKFWVAGDLGGDFTQGQMDWAVLTFEPSATKEQRDAVATILGKVYPVKWNSFAIGPDAPISWTASKDRAEAKANDGKLAQVVLVRSEGMTAEPIVIHNLRYWGAPRNDGFVLMPNTVEAWRGQGKPFEFTGTNGFMITFDITSKDVM